MAVAAVLSGLALVDFAVTGWRKGVPFLASDVPSKFRTLGCFFSMDGRSSFIQDSYYKNADGSPIRTRADLNLLVKTLRDTKAKVYTSLDTYLTLVYSWRALEPEDVYRVFPHPADSHCQEVPEVSAEQDNRLRRVAHYYWTMSQKKVINWSGDVVTNAHRACHTISYRSNADYQLVKRETRALIKPAEPNHLVFQFDWSAAEWSLILQICGYEVPPDAYGAFVQAGLDRDLTKQTILSWVYGASHDTLVAKAGSEVAVNAVIGLVKETYPKVMGLVEVCRSNSSLMFENWNIKLGDSPHSRPNHYAQTALQLCKWELMDRLLTLNGHELACGDLHDQLLFDFDPAKDSDTVASMIQEIKKPIFGKYKMTANFRVGNSWLED